MVIITITGPPPPEMWKPATKFRSRLVDLRRMASPQVKINQSSQKSWLKAGGEGEEGEKRLIDLLRRR